MSDGRTQRRDAVQDDETPTQVRPVTRFPTESLDQLSPQRDPQPMTAHTVVGSSASDIDADENDNFFRRAGSKLSSGARDVAAAVQKGADVAASKARTAVEVTSDKLEAVAQDGPGGLRTTSTTVSPVPGINEYPPTGADRRPMVRRTRKARLRISRIDPWSVMKTTFLFAIAFAVIQFVAVWMLWSVISASGAFDAVNSTLGDLLTSPGSTNTFKLQTYVNSSRVLGLTAVLGVVDVLLITALSTLGSFLYNLAATVLGGLEVTLAED